MSEQIIIPGRISRRFIQLNTQWNFVYSSDVPCCGVFGQMWFAHGEPNAYPIPVLMKICQSSTDKFFYDSAFEFFQKHINDFINRIPTDKPIVMFPKIGEGYSQMKKLAPRLHAYLLEEINKILWPNILVDWNNNYNTFI